jgi:dolichyl-phosphate beta-glucosyltransferase
MSGVEELSMNRSLTPLFQANRVVLDPNSKTIASTIATIRLSVVMPVHNEQDVLAETIAAVLVYACNHPDVEFIFVDDGSRDRTLPMLQQQLQAGGEQLWFAGQVRYLAYPQCRGKGYAIKQGVQLAAGEYICFLDGDLAYSLDHLAPLLENLANYDVVIGCRNLVDKSLQGVKPSRQIAGKTFNWLSQRILRLYFSDMQAGLKGFRRSVALRLFERLSIHGFAFDVELMYLAKKKGYRIGEIPAYLAEHHVQKPSKVKLVQDSLRMLGELWKIRYYDWLGRYE